MIRIQDLSKSFGNKAVLRGIQLELQRGKAYGVVGENGSGKTTLFRCIAGLEGFEGVITSDFRHIKDHIGFLPTNPVFMSRITGWEYLKLMCVARGIREDHFEEQNIFELPLGQYAETYSTGMKKKLALLGILLQQNELFILDEPFNGVDIHSNIIIAELIKRLKAKDKTILISSHIFSTLSDNCDEICLLKDGAFVKRVLPEEFRQLDEEMREFVVGNKINNLLIR